MIKNNLIIIYNVNIFTIDDETLLIFYQEITKTKLKLPQEVANSRFS